MDTNLHIHTRDSGEGCVLELSGRFDHATAGGFGKAIRQCMQREGREVVADFRGIEYIDSMAMGTLLIYRERLANAGKTLVLGNCTGLVRDAMQLANFQKIFEIR